MKPVKTDYLDSTIPMIKKGTISGTKVLDFGLQKDKEYRLRATRLSGLEPKDSFRLTLLYL